MVPLSIRRVADLPPNATLREMQQDAHGRIRATTPNDESISSTQGATQFVDLESISPTQGTAELCGL